MISKMKEFYGKYIVENLEVTDSKDLIEKKTSFVVWKLRSILLAFLLLWGLSAVLISFFIKDEGERGTFGDMFGAVNALFSAFAFGGLVYTLYVQRYELSLQRKELEMQRQEVKRNGDQLEEQKNVMIQQSFENTFFKMIELHHNLRNTQVYGVFTGYAAIGSVRADLFGIVHDAESKQDLISRVKKYFEQGSGLYIKNLLNNFYCVLLLIDQFCSKTGVPVRDSDYTLIALAQLTDTEMYILFYAFSYNLESKLLLQKFIDLNELNPNNPKHCAWMME